MATLSLKDCSFTFQVGGVPPASTLPELLHGLKHCSTDSLYHHFCHPVLHRRAGDTEFYNDLAIWAAQELRDRVLAERLSMINPFALDSLESLRERTVEVVGLRLDETGKIPQVPAVNAFRFIRCVTVVFPTSVELQAAGDLLRAVNEIGDHSLFYHFIEARMANGRRKDDFSVWLSSLADTPDDLVKSISDLDFYYMSLDEVRSRLVQLLGGR